MKRRRPAERTVFQRRLFALLKQTNLLQTALEGSGEYGPEPLQEVLEELRGRGWPSAHLSRALAAELPAYLRRRDEVWFWAFGPSTTGGKTRTREATLQRLAPTPLEPDPAYDPTLDIVKGIRLCLEQGLRTPVLILAFSGIDSWAWLARPEGKQDSSRQDFIEWVERFMLPGSSLNCTAEDLYGARCAVLHSLTAESRLSRQAQARMVFYSWGDADYEAFANAVRRAPIPAVAVRGEDLVGAFLRACLRFAEALETDTALRARVSPRLRHRFGFVRRRPVQGL